MFTSTEVPKIGTIDECMEGMMIENSNANSLIVSNFGHLMLINPFGKNLLP